ncbi:hypothetical protein BKA70DRAFT_1266737 [Coprinopsis sp. MPI-PUGE-AT-0042]|nr:hypothetical protein BKA70DRAFT_1266737 [Coprinopsis sp. MPI-PUGE-AT-0042]
MTAGVMHQDLKGHLVAPGSLYLPNFINEEEEEYLIRKIEESSQQKWKILANRRLQIWGGDITEKGTLCAQPLPDFIRKFPDVISKIQRTGAFASSPHQQPNHVIMNEYLPGQGIMAHEDGPVYHPVVATLSLGSHCVFDYYKYQSSEPSVASGGGRAIEPTPTHSLLLERRSLVISFDDMYTSHLHGIDGVTEDLVRGANASGPSTATRIDNFDLLGEEALKEAIREGKPLGREPRWSLTCRDVVRTANLTNRGIHLR